MDPVSFVLSTYLNAVQTNVHNHIVDSMGAEIKAISIEYEGSVIPFTYQLWRIRKNSVCYNQMDNIVNYSDCTVKAKSLFEKICSQLSRSTSNHWRVSKTRNMYCVAAVEYKPTIAKLESSNAISQLDKAKQECNIATVKALGSQDSKDLSERAEKCEIYNQLKNDSNLENSSD
ncbi:MAG: hypothetical protein R3F53_15770 [Gammaproteobacteria bacterium]